MKLRSFAFLQYRVDETFPMEAHAMLRMVDANNDSRVSLQEATNAALQRFDRVDRNRDGSITRDERQQRRQRQAPAAR